MKDWFFSRQFNRFDLAAIVASAYAGEYFGLWATIAFVIGAIVLSVLGERSLRAEMLKSTTAQKGGE